MIIMKNDLPKMHYHIKKHLSTKSGYVKKAFFSRHISVSLYHKLQKQVDLRLACIACLRFHANAVIKTTYQLKHQKRMYYLVASGVAIYAGELTDSKTALNKGLAKLGVVGDSLAPLSAKLDNNVLNMLEVNDYNDNLTQARNGDKNEAENIAHTLTYDTRFAHLATYHNPSITHQVMVDILHLGIITRLLGFNPDIANIHLDNHQLTYTTAQHRTYHYEGNKSILNPDLIHNLVKNLVNNPWMTITKKFNHKNDTVTYSGLYHYLHFTVLSKLSDKTPNDHISIVNTALNQLLRFHPTTTTISCIGNNIVVDYKFKDKDNKHSSNKLMLANTAKQLTNEVKASVLHPSVYQYNPTSGYTDNFGDDGSITYSQYADFKAIIISSSLSKDNQPIIILKAE